METLTPRHSGPVQIRLAWLDTIAEPDGFELLDDDERARAARFAFERDRRGFVARRAFLRRVLAELTGLQPAAIRYRRATTGKPELADGPAIAFNTSRADDLAIVAIGTDREVGVDIERVRPMADALDVARRFFSQKELAHLRSVRRAARSEAFLRLWTRKEAYVKLLGRGLAIRLDSFDVLDRDGTDGVAPVGDVAPVRGVALPPAHLWSVGVPEGYVASVAVGSAGGIEARSDQLAVAS